MMKSKLLRKVLITIVIVALVGVAAVAVAQAVTSPIGQVYSYPTSPGIMAGAPLTYWIPQENQYSVKTGAGSFEIKDYVIDNLKIYIFFVMESQKPGLPGVTVLSSDAGPYQPQPKPDAEMTPVPTPTVDLKQSKAIPVKSVQIIDTFDRIEVGMITLEVPDQPNQLVTFRITPPGDTQTTWQLTPFHQINALGPNSLRQGGTSLQTYMKELPWYTDINVEMPIFGGDENTTGVLKIFRIGTNMPPLYLQLDRQGNLSPFSLADCAKILPPPPTNPPQHDGGPVTATVAVPAPCNGNS